MSTFDWNTHEPSIFATPEALRYAKASAISSANVSAQQAKKPRLKLDIRTRKTRKKCGVDLDRLRKLLSDGHTQVECAAIFGVSAESIRRRLGLEKPRIRDNTISTFNVAIATPAQSDRTNSIAGRV